MVRVSNWLLFALLLPVATLTLVALTKWEHGQNFLDLVTDEELLAVAFTLAGASGIDALTSTAYPGLRALQSGIGGLTILLAFISAIVYFILKTHSHHLDASATQLIETVLFVGVVVVSFFSEVVA